MNAEWLNRIALTLANKTRLRTLRQAFDKYNSATEIIAHHPELITREAISQAQKELDFIKKHSVQLYYYKDSNYPYRLAQCTDAPLLLYAKGNVEVNPKHVVSIVGTRMPSEQGKDWCRRLVLDLASQSPDLSQNS